MYLPKFHSILSSPPFYTTAWPNHLKLFHIIFSEVSFLLLYPLVSLISFVLSILRFVVKNLVLDLICWEGFRDTEVYRVIRLQIHWFLFTGRNFHISDERIRGETEVLNQKCNIVRKVFFGSP